MKSPCIKVDDAWHARDYSFEKIVSQSDEKQNWRHGMKWDDDGWHMRARCGVVLVIKHDWPYNRHNEGVIVDDIQSECPTCAELERAYQAQRFANQLKADGWTAEDFSALVGAFRGS